MGNFRLRDFAVGPGALGTNLQKVGLPAGAAPEHWNLERAPEVVGVHAAYADAGAAWLVANTFGGNRPRLRAAGLDHLLPRVNRAGVELAHAFAGNRPVLASIGPTGAASAAEWERAYAEQVEWLAGAGAAGFLVETIMRFEEGLAAVRAACAAAIGPVIASFTPGPDGMLLDAIPPDKAGAAWRAAGAAVVGVNCGTGPESLLEPARRLVAAGGGPVYAAPSAGLPLIESGVACYTLTPDAFARAAIQFREAGVIYFAGCCGVGPQHVRAAVARMREEGPAKP